MIEYFIKFGIMLILAIIGGLSIFHLEYRKPYNKGDCVTYYDGTYLVRASVEYCIKCYIRNKLKFILVLDNDKIIYSDQVLEND